MLIFGRNQKKFCKAIILQLKNKFKKPKTVPSKLGQVRRKELSLWQVPVSIFFLFSCIALGLERGAERFLFYLLLFIAIDPDLPRL